MAGATEVAKKNEFGGLTGDRVVDTFATGQTTVTWFPVAQGVFELTDTAKTKADVRVTFTSSGTTTTIYGIFANAASAKTGTLANMTFKNLDGTAATHTFTADDKLSYVYNNIVVPQEKQPTIKATMENIPLLAKARRITVYYSQMAAFQAKTDYGINLGDSLTEQACGQLSYEIDSEVVGLLYENAVDHRGTAADPGVLRWSKTLPVGVNKKDHYAGFMEILGIADQKIYDATAKFAANYMIIASDIKPVLMLMDAFKPAAGGQMNGPYFAGTLGSLKVFVSPALDAGDFVIGVNGNDLYTSAAVYAPYMPIVPTQLLQFSDGGTTQGLNYTTKKLVERSAA